MAGQRSPFQGLGFYTEADAKWFFGRMTERKIILAHLRTARLTLLYAESGVGKSSLLRAGVAARLRELARRSIETSRSPKFVPVVFSAWKDDPVADLISEIEQQVRALVPSTNGSPAVGAPPADGLAGAIRAAARALDATLVIILDQFEEHFGYRLGGSHPDQMADELARCVNAPDVLANFLIAVREDAYGQLGDLFSGRISNVYNNYLHLEYLTRDAARDAIEKPVEIYNAEHDPADAIALDDDLADAVLDEVKRGHLELGLRRPDRDGGVTWLHSNEDQIETPFLQLVMTRLWECERGQGSRVLRTSTLNDELGGAETIVRNHVDRALAGLEGQQLETATDIFHDLVTPSGMKVAHTAGDLAKMSAHSEDVVQVVLGRLHEERIVRAVDPAPGTTQARYEIYHDRLAAPILDWRNHQENERLERAKQQAELEAETQRRQARRFKRQARITLGLAVGLLILLAAGLVLLHYAQDKSATASREKRQATYAGLTTRAQSQFNDRPDVSLLLYLAAYRQSPQGVAERNLAATLQAVRRSGASGILHGHTDTIESIAFSPSGTTLASASGDKTVRLWAVSPTGGYPIGTPLRANEPLYSDAFAPDGATLASGGFNDIILWNVARHAEQGVIPYHSGAVASVAFSRRGHVLAAGGSDGTVLLWNMVTHAQRTLTVSHAGSPVTDVAFSPDGRTLATSSGHEVMLWNAAEGFQREGQPFIVPGRTIYAVAFSPDGRTLAAGGGFQEVALWNVATPGPPFRTLSGLRTVYSIAFNRDGRTIAAGGARTTMVWDLGGQSRYPLNVRQGAVYSVAFSPDGGTLASAGANRTVSLWDFRHGLRPATSVISQPGGASEIAISPDEREIASAGDNGHVYVWNRRTGALLETLPADAGQVHDLAFDPAGGVVAAAYDNGTVGLWDGEKRRRITLDAHTPVFSLAFNPSGTRLASGGADGTVRLWNVQSHQEIGHPLPSDHGAAYALAFSPNGLELASAGAGRAIHLWDVRTRTPLSHALIPQANAAFSLDFSPDGRLLASGGADDTIHLWRVASWPYASIESLTGAANFIRSVAFSPDGQTLASGSTDDSVRLWDVRSGTQLSSPLIGHTRSVENVEFSRHGTFLVSGSSDGTVRVWQDVNVPASFATVRAEVCSFLGAGLSGVEWVHYAPDVPYQRSCPRTTPS